ncbi:MAG: hypothetical protein KBA66_09180 [Leptospiraceae bacterium]|nr:hypothetical protein [Leptospiraceae bacterium]
MKKILKYLAILIACNLIVTSLALFLFIWIEEGEHPMSFTPYESNQTELGLKLEFFLDGFLPISLFFMPYTLVLVTPILLFIYFFKRMRLKE